MSDNELKKDDDTDLNEQEIPVHVENKDEQEIEKEVLEEGTEEQAEDKDTSEIEEDDEIIEVSEKEFKKLQSDAKDYYDRMLRALAELENFRKRVQKDKEQYLKFSNENIVKEIIDIYENFDRALYHIDEAKEEESIDNIIEGIKMIKTQLFNILEKNGIEEIKCEGEEFDPKFHEAVQVVETDDSENKVVQVLQRGYTMYNKVIKPPMVAVSKKKDEKEE